MSYFDSKFSTSFCCFIFILLVAGCSQCTGPESAQKSEWKNDLVQNYCGPALSKLAQGIPEGVQPIVERVNPYPAIPDYRMFPDVSPTHHTAKMLFKLARCVHQKCVNGDSKKKKKSQKANAPMPASCEGSKANYMLKSLLDVANSCGGSRYLKARMAQTLKDVYQENEGEPMQVCKALLEGEDIVAEALGEPVNECDLLKNDCEGGLRCVINGEGTRCVETPGTDLGPLVYKLGEKRDQARGGPKEPGFSYEEKTAGTACTTSRQCSQGASCVGIFGGISKCAKHCSVKEDCPENQRCYGYLGTSRICVDSCDSSEIAKAGDDALCVPTGEGGVKANLDATGFMDAYKSKGDKKTLWDEASFNALVAGFESKAECGNGIVEFPEACDAGESNGDTAYGAWCSSKCEIAQCGDGKLEAPESCECLPGWSLKAAKDDSTEKFNTLCPASFARSNGSEVALGWVCSSKCQVITPPEAFMSPRKNKNYLPEFICMRPKRADGTFRPECIPTNVGYDPTTDTGGQGEAAPVNPAAPLLEKAPAE